MLVYQRVYAWSRINLGGTVGWFLNMRKTTFFIAIVKLYVNDDDKPWKFGVTYFETNPFGEFVANLHGNILVLKSVKAAFGNRGLAAGVD